MKKRVWAMVLAVTLCFGYGGAFAETARDITRACSLSSPKRETKAACDGQYTTCFSSRETVNPYLEIQTPSGESAAYLYLCFGEIPESWAVEARAGDGWETLYTGDNRFAHVLVELDSQTHLRVVDTTGDTCRLQINEAYVFTEGDLPDWVQRWEPTWEKADMLVLSAHPDDELIFFGGTIPTYSAERGLRVVVAYMTYASPARRSELLNGLWHMGVRNYPVLGAFKDVYTNSLKDAYAKWKKDDVQAYASELVRRYRPEVIVTHDVNGEYGHGAHRICADVMKLCFERAADPAFVPGTAISWGTWQPKKLYLHMGKNRSMTMDWRVPLASMGGKTGLELAQEAYGFHITQHSTPFQVKDEGKQGCHLFGLEASMVGDDVLGGDFMENILIQP